MRIRGNISPEIIHIEPYAPTPGYVEIRLRENIKEVTEVDEMTETEVTMFEYDEFVFHETHREGLREEIENNLTAWMQTGRELEVNVNASMYKEVQDQAEAEISEIYQSADEAYSEGVNSI